MTKYKRPYCISLENIYRYFTVERRIENFINRKNMENTIYEKPADITLKKYSSTHNKPAATSDQRQKYFNLGSFKSDLCSCISNPTGI